MALRFKLGNLFDIVGTALRLPEMNISERIAGGPTYNTQGIPTIGTAYQPPTLLGRSTYQPARTYQPASTTYGGQVVPVQPAANPFINQGASSYYQPPSQDQINAIYDPMYSNLISQEGRIGQEYQDLLGSLEQHQAQDIGQLKAGEESASASLRESEEEAALVKSNAMQQARQLYNELTQNYLSRFGTGTSAGPAAQELLGRATTQAFGSAEDAYSRAVSKLTRDKDELGKFVMREMNNLNLAYSDKRMEAGAQRNQQENLIRQNRAMLDSQKAQAILNVNEQYKDFMRELEIWKLETAVNISAWTSDQQAKMQQAFQTIGQIPMTKEQLGAYTAPISQTPGKILAAGRVGQRAPTVRRTNVRYASPEEEDLWQNYLA